MKKKLTLDFGSAPVDEPCAQLGSDDYEHRAKLECIVYREQLLRTLKESSTYQNSKPDHPPDEEIPKGLNVRIKSREHDFGTYYEVVASFDESDKAAVFAAYWLDENLPLRWDTLALKQLGKGDVNIDEFDKLRNLLTIHSDALKMS